MEKTMKKILISLITCTSISLMAMNKQVIPMSTVTTPHYPQNQPYSPSMEQPRPAKTKKANDDSQCLAKACTYTTIGLCAPLGATAWAIDKVCCHWCCCGTSNDND
jgi:hypothetical protein